MAELSRRSFLLGLGAAAPGDRVRGYFSDFNAFPGEPVESHIPDERSFEWVMDLCPRFECPDTWVERVYYYRWWSLRKHLRKTPAGFIFTEFLRPVRHATDYNAVSCALGHHIAEARWLADPVYLDEYLRFWLTSGQGRGFQRHYHAFSNWTAHAVFQRWLVDGRTPALLALFDQLLADYAFWERERLLPSGLFWQYDVRDGMEESISGGRKAKNARPTINSYMFGNARALARIARIAGRPAIAKSFQQKAERLRALVENTLWDPEARFYKPRLENGALAGVREQIGFTPWFTGLPGARGGRAEAWRQLLDPEGFHAPFGPTTAEQRHPGFQIAESGDDCQWNGPSWPFSTTVTLTALANLLESGVRAPVSVRDYFETFLIYARSHQIRLDDGRVAAFVDENLNPFTGEWHARARKLKKKTFYGRGDHYNHSAFNDLVITGLCGLRPREGGRVEVRPLLPEGAWDWFRLEGVRYQGRQLTIVWDRDGSKYGQGAGLRVEADGRRVAGSRRLERVRGTL
ncbi:MAG TPA: hypothetical protein PLF84_22150 [Bryobacteraceae bacterium]|nr:hypothetical protein [Bryobacteraceae bacterium]